MAFTSIILNLREEILWDAVDLNTTKDVRCVGGLLHKKITYKLYFFEVTTFFLGMKKDVQLHEHFDAWNKLILKYFLLSNEVSKRVYG